MIRLDAVARVARRRVDSLAIFPAVLLIGGCGGEAGSDVATVVEPSVSLFVDNSASPVHVQVKVCTTDSPVQHPVIDCTVDSGYALVGGGASAEWTANGALLTQSAPISARTWRAASKDHEYVDSHHLTSYAIGLRLDGVNAASLRSIVVRPETTFPSGGTGTSKPSASINISPLNFLLGGGATTTTSGNGQLLTQLEVWPSGSGTWAAASSDHLVSSPGFITAIALRLATTGILEGFGAIEIQRLTGTTTSVSTGVGTSTGSVSSGWGLVGIGAKATTSSGPGRMLFHLGLNGSARDVVAQSKDHGVVSAGDTRVSWSQVRKTPGSHGLCNPGIALASSMDSCVAAICVSDPYCCNTQWDLQCVNEVESICSRPCVDYRCGPSSFAPAFWNDNGTAEHWNNCYNYATNKRTDTFAQPGRSSDEWCEHSGCYSGPSIRIYATNDGLIPTTLAAGCPENRSLLALVTQPGFDYHWYRRDSSGFWSHKPGGSAATNLDNSGNPISSPETADRGLYTEFAGYFCACSDQLQGQGHSFIN